MSFIFTVEVGDADPDANSYADLDYADAYISANSYAYANWTALDETAQQAALIRATKYIDTMVEWYGSRVDPESGLRWPRSGVYDADGFEFPDDQIPAILQDATCELASLLITDDWTQSQPTKGMKELKVDVIELQFDTKMTRPSLPDFVIEMLSDLGSVKRGTRPAFKKIIRK